MKYTAPKYHIKKEIVLKDDAGRLVNEVEVGEGFVNKILERPVCSVCGVIMKRAVLYCPNCGKYVCRPCSIVLYGRRLCLNCVKSRYDLSLEEWMVLKYLSSNLSSRLSIRFVARSLHMSRKLVKDVLRRLIEKRFLSKKGYGLFTEYYVTHLGFEALKIIGRIYNNYSGMDAWEYESEY